MTIPSSGAIKLSVINTEFYQSKPYTIGKVKNDLWNQDPSLKGKPVKFSYFRGRSGLAAISIGNSYNQNIRSILNTKGMGSFKNIRVTITGKVGSKSATSPALRTGTLASGAKVEIIINKGAQIAGRGGNGGNGGSGGNGGAGGNGGGALLLESAGTYTIKSAGTIGGGGGGGGGGGARRACAKGNKGGCTQWSNLTGGGGNGGTGNVAGSNGSGTKGGSAGAGGAGGGLGKAGAKGGNATGDVGAGKNKGANWVGGAGGQPGYAIHRTNTSSIKYTIAPLPSSTSTVLGPKN